MRLAVGRFGWMRGKGSVRPTTKWTQGQLNQDGKRKRERTGDGDRQDKEEVDVEELRARDVSDEGRDELSEPHTWKSPRVDAMEYSNETVVNWMSE